MTAAELKVSPTTVVFESSPAVALAAHVGFNAEGYTIKVASSAAGLAYKRVEKAERRTDRIVSTIRKHASLAKIATGLWAIGAKDPGIELRKQTIEEWLQLWFASPTYRRRIIPAWRLVHQKTISYGNK
ncbi:unnamed protein product, partial [Prorocentrum cordatum]